MQNCCAHVSCEGIECKAVVPLVLVKAGCGTVLQPIINAILWLSC
jgi:hypothetical protein